MKIVSIIGARPQFIKAAGISRVLRTKHEEFILHTGQHYDYEMAGIFFDGLEMQPPNKNLEVGSGSHGAQTGRMLQKTEGVLIAERPELVLVYGDTNSTLAGSLAAAKLHIPIAHIEAGLRSYNRRMPEEINRVVTDHLSSQLFCPSDLAVRNLAAEGITKNVHMIGDVMLDVLNWAKQRIAAGSTNILGRLGIERGQYILLTIHRSENTDDPDRLQGIVDAINDIDERVAFPVHPRTRKIIEQTNSKLGPHVLPIEPLGYIDMIMLSSYARLIMTDSGGLQKEAYWLGVPCITLRNETEWVETVDAGWNTLAGSESRKILFAVSAFKPPVVRPPLYGDGRAAEKFVALLG